jgi:protein involved in polysaccharide export with SLBB domain
MNKFFSTLLLIFPFLVISQDIDEAFLQTLPKNIQQDILNKVDENKSLEDPIYRGIETQSKLDKITLEELKRGLDRDFQYFQDLIKDYAASDDLKLFGADFFRTYQSTYMPINEPNLNYYYELDYGDSVEIQFIGQKDEIGTFLINRDGTINIPDIGPLSIAGLSFENASAFIKAKVGEAYIGTEAFVRLKNLRDINILVSGNAFNPGVYTVSGNSNLLHALSVSGGINKFGSYREINLIRNEEVIESLDMYDVLLKGKYNIKTPLKSGDIIFVKPAKKIISVYGAVKNPAKFELKDNQSLSDAIFYANGISFDADLNNLYIERILDGKIQSLQIRSIKQFDDILAKDGDAIYLRKHNFKTVNINGEVLKPGKYLMADNETLSDLIEKSGGLKANAYSFGAVYETQKALMINGMAKEKLFNEFVDNIILLSQKNPTGFFDTAGIVDLTSTIKDSQPNGRVVIDLNDDFTTNTYVLNDGDSLTIPEKPNHIYVYGEINFEGALQFVNNESVDFYISKSGGFKQQANKEMIYVLHPNGNTQMYYGKRRNIFQNSPSEEQLRLYPGSVIFVPKAIDDTASRRLAAQAYVSILGNIGIALASLSSINNN